FRNRDEAFKVMLYLRGRALGQSGPKIEFDRDAIESETLGWTKPEDLLSPVLSQVLFTQQLGKLSPIVEDGDYLHLLRVLERQAAGTQSFDEVSDQLKREVVANRRRDAEQRLIAELRKEARIWCVYVDGGDDVGPDVEQEPATRTAARPGRASQPAPRTDRSNTRPSTNSALRPNGALPAGSRSTGGLRTSATSPSSMSPSPMTSPPITNSPMASGAVGPNASSPSPMATGGTLIGGARLGGSFSPQNSGDVAPVAYEEPVGTSTPVATPSPTSVRSQGPIGSAGSIGAVAPVGPSAGQPAPVRRGPASSPGLLVPPVSPLKIPSLALPPTSAPASPSRGGAAAPVSAAQPLQPARSFVQPLPPAGAE
ncbi:MAG TPA: hypothetical protein PLV92_24960, partial [Pirellulaceae bacterium]|nr:hypothetical protein [Pirellulaceae bacterium]